jgi:hypothetical protein
MLATLMARADDTTCPYNAAKFVPALKTAVTTFLKEDVAFPWNPASLKVNCGQNVGGNSSAIVGCAITFQANDGTSFFLHDDPQCYYYRDGTSTCDDYSETSMSLNALNRTRESDGEGNFTAPAQCEADIDLPYVINKKTGVALPLKDINGIPKVVYQE